MASVGLSFWILWTRLSFRVLLMQLKVHEVPIWGLFKG